MILESATINVISLDVSHFAHRPRGIGEGCLTVAHLHVGKEGGWGKEGEKHNYPDCTKESVAAAWQVSRTEAVLHHLAIRPGCIGTRGPCLASRHAPFLSPLPRFITQCSARHREPLHHFLCTTAVRPLAASQPGLPKDQAGYICCPSGIRSHSLLMYTAEARVEGHNQWLPTFFQSTDELKYSKCARLNWFQTLYKSGCDSACQCLSQFGHICCLFVLLAKFSSLHHIWGLHLVVFFCLSLSMSDLYIIYSLLTDYPFILGICFIQWFITFS